MQAPEEQWKDFERHHGKYLTAGPDKNGNTALHEAASGGYEHVALDLIKQGHDINAQNAYGESVMHQAVLSLVEPSNPRAIQQALINAGVDLQVVDKAGNSLMHIAAYAGDGEMCKYLSQRAGLDVNAQTVDGKTPLHCAVTVNSGETVDQLLHLGADPSITSCDRKTARDMAVGKDAKEVLDNHAFEQRMKSVQPPNPQDALGRLAARTPSPAFEGRKW